MTQPNKRFRSRTLRILFHLLPRHTKRMLFLASLAGKVTSTHHLSKSILLKLQQEFQLCADTKAIDLPPILHKKIWGNRPIEGLVCPVHLDAQQSERCMTRTARQIVSIMPCWLVYAHTTQIIEDVRDMLSKREVLFAT